MINHHQNFDIWHFRATTIKSASFWTSPIRSTRSSLCASTVLSCGLLEKLSQLLKSWESTSVLSGINLSCTLKTDRFLRPKAATFSPTSSRCREMLLWGSSMILSSELVLRRYRKFNLSFAKMTLAGSLLHYRAFARQHAGHVRQRKGKSKADCEPPTNVYRVEQSSWHFAWRFPRCSKDAGTPQGFWLLKIPVSSRNVSQKGLVITVLLCNSN